MVLGRCLKQKNPSNQWTQRPNLLELQGRVSWTIHRYVYYCKIMVLNNKTIDNFLYKSLISFTGEVKDNQITMKVKQMEKLRPSLMLVLPLKDGKSTMTRPVWLLKITSIMMELHGTTLLATPDLSSFAKTQTNLCPS